MSLVRVPRDALAAAGLAALVLVLFLPIWGRGLTPFWLDLTYLHHPWRAFDAEVLAAGRVPLWNPYLYFGMPQAASMQDSLFHPGTLPFFFFGFATATAVFHAVHYWLAGFLTYLWLRSLGLSRLACWAGAALASLGGLMLARMIFLNHLAVLSLVPAFLLFFRRPPLLALVLSMAFFAGYPTYLLGAAAMAWVLAAATTRSGRTLAAAAKGWVLAAGLAAPICACLLLPALELFVHSRRAMGITLDEALRYSFAPRDLVQWISPLLVPWKEFDPANQWWTCAYLGFSGALAAAWGLWKLPRRAAAAVALALGVLLLLSLGGSNPLSLAAWTSLPGLGLIRYPGNLAPLAAPAFCLLAAVGIHDMRRRAVLVGMIALELSLYPMGAFPLADRRLFTEAGPLVRHLQAGLGGNRYLLSPRALESGSGRDFLDWKQRLYGLTNAPYRLRAAANFGEPLVPRGSYEFMDALYRAPSAASAAELFPWGGIRCLMTPEKLPASSRLKHEGRILWEIYRYEGDISRAYLFGEEGERIPAALGAPLPPAGRPLAWRAESERELDIAGAGEGWVFMAEPRYPGWRLLLDSPSGARFLDSRPALGAFQKARVPPGPWILRLRYDPSSWRMGLLLTLAALMGLALYWYNRARLPPHEI